MAAQNSLGRPPLPHHLLAGVSDVCPTHREQMKVREVPIIFSDGSSGTTEPFELQATAEFPFGAEKVISSANSLLPGEPISARIYQCASCVTARRASETKRPPTAAR